MSNDMILRLVFLGALVIVAFAAFAMDDSYSRPATPKPQGPTKSADTAKPVHPKDYEANRNHAVGLLVE